MKIWKGIKAFLGLLGTIVCVVFIAIGIVVGLLFSLLAEGFVGGIGLGNNFIDYGARLVVKEEHRKKCSDDKDEYGLGI